MLASIAQAVARHARLVVLGWAVLVGALVAWAPTLGEVVTHDDTAFLAEDAPSVRGGTALGEIWPEDELGNTAAIVFRRDAGLTDEDRAYIRDVEEWLLSPAAPQTVERTQSPWSRPELRDALASEDGRVIIVIAGFETPPFTPESNEAVREIRAEIVPGAPQGLRVHVTGNAGVGADESAAIDAAVHRTTIITLFLVSGILLWVYRSPVTPLVLLATVGVALVVSRGVVGLLADAGLQISSLVETFMIVIVFGAGTDYCLFIVSRYKEELGLAGVPGERGRRPRLVGTMAVIGGLMASSAATTMVGFSAQGIAEFGLYRTTGPALAISVGVILVAGLTLTPALLATLGRWAFWPWRPRPEGERMDLPA